MLKPTFSLALAALGGIAASHGELLVYEPFDCAVVNNPVFGQLACRALAQNLWSSQKRIVELMDILCTYGARAKPVIPQLESHAEDISKGEKDFPNSLSLQKAEVVRQAIRTIEASKDSPDLIRIQKTALLQS